MLKAGLDPSKPLHAMERAALQAFVWQQGIGMLGLLALQTATHGEWRPSAETRLTLRTLCASMHYIMERRESQVAVGKQTGSR